MSKNRTRTTSSSKDKKRLEDCNTADVSRRRKWFYEKNTPLLDHSVNKTFEEVLWMSEQQFEDWVAELRRVVVEIWDKKGLPPTTGKRETELIKLFNKIETFPVQQFLNDDEYAGTKQDVILNISDETAGAANQWFPTMMKTKINYSKKLDAGRSIYDHFARNDLFETTLELTQKHFRRDSFYSYSRLVPYCSTDLESDLFSCTTGKEWIEKFEATTSARETHDYWLAPVKDGEEYSGYNEEIKNKEFLKISVKELQTVSVPDTCKTNINTTSGSDKDFHIRVFEKGNKIFPAGFQAIKNSYSQAVVNFPPLTAKFLYERYINKLNIDRVTVWDPSSGWGGRILGAMGVKSTVHLHYIGTDPNTDHNTENGRTKYHELADFYNQLRTGQMEGFAKLPWATPHANTYEIYQCGSEEMHTQKHFQKYKGKVDIVFTSPPYFAKELYSADARQSATRFNQYESWRDNFLKRTLMTAVEWLKPGGYLLWNIADVAFGNELLPLEDDSCSILTSLKMTKVKTLKMALAKKPGKNRLKDAEGEFLEIVENEIDGGRVTKVPLSKPSAKNSCKVWMGDKEQWFKYEPIFVYQKPIPATKLKNRSLNYASEPNGQLRIRASKLMQDFKKALSASKVNPHWLRAIYHAIETTIATSGNELLSESIHNLKKLSKYEIARIDRQERKDLPMLILKEPVNKKPLRLVGKFVLLQLFRTNRKKLERVYAWAEVIEFERRPHVWHVKVDPDKKFAEGFFGLSIAIESFNILKVAESPVPFDKIKRNWIY